MWVSIELLGAAIYGAIGWRGFARLAVAADRCVALASHLGQRASLLRARTLVLCILWRISLS